MSRCSCWRIDVFRNSGKSSTVRTSVAVISFLGASRLGFGGVATLAGELIASVYAAASDLTAIPWSLKATCMSESIRQYSAAGRSKLVPTVAC
ncbi:JM128 [macacine gammaherpesvirus 11]|uniref:JM128 n=2 Tax=macacine gammaherpesvirus 11 TaxID=2560570 RepID=G9JMD6_9GAMA|nr:JM128 [Macaca fuscata rhadinovirus]AAT00105.1 JM128 [Macaca fuscata rhadinovirus]AEW87653.1 JM128 [Macaca fuscata rhadinovirus]AEW87823.1 JM128 [Macaca fuscata rhadinovirus]